MADTESAEEFAMRIERQAGDCECAGCMQPLIEERDAATREAAKLELLEELAYALRCRQSGEGIWIGPLDALALAVDDILEKNGRKLWGLSKVRRWAIPSKHTQPVEPGQERR